MARKNCNSPPLPKQTNNKKICSDVQDKILQKERHSNDSPLQKLEQTTVPKNEESCSKKWRKMKFCSLVCRIDCRLFCSLQAHIF